MYEYRWNFSNSLSYGAAYSAFKDLLEWGGLDLAAFALHSPRAGGTTDAFQAGVPDYIIDIKGRW